MIELKILSILLILIIILNFHNVLCSDESNQMMEKTPQKFTTTFEGFMPLVDKVYSTAKYGIDRNKVSLSMWRYYMVQHLYARLALIRVEKGIADDVDNGLAAYVFAAIPHLPKAMFNYLKEIGDIMNFTTGEVFKFDVPIWPNSDGNFGNIDSDNHWKYMSFPAPSILIQAIREDYRYTMNPLINPFWNLEGDLRPKWTNISYPGLPTVNLLGWMPSTRLTDEQIKILDIVGINDYDSAVSNSQFQLNTNLLEYIHRDFKGNLYERVSPDKYPNSLKKLSNNVQLGWLERIQSWVPSDDVLIPFGKEFVPGMYRARLDKPFSRRVYYADRTGTGKTFPPLNEIKEKKILIFGFRVEKTKDPNDWSIYDWNHYKDVPESWIETRNTIFEYGNISSGDAVGFPASIERDARRAEFIRDAR